MFPTSAASDRALWRYKPAMDMRLLARFWHPVAQSSDLARRPLERTVCGRKLVVFRDREGRAQILDARCPHRGANLARGKVVDGGIECPYHGWRFDGSGRCVRIPTQPCRVPSGFSVRAYPAIESQGFLWTSVADDSPIGEVPRFDALDQPGLRRFVVEEEIAAPFDWWMENVLDVAHVPFTHKLTYGGKPAAIDRFSVERRADDLGFSARTELRQDYGLLARLLHGSLGELALSIRLEHWMPGATLFDVDVGAGHQRRVQRLLFLTTPVDANRSRVWIAVYRNYLRFSLGDLIGKLFARAIISEDMRIANSAVERNPMAMRGRLNAAVDEPSIEMMRLMSRWAERIEAEDRGGDLAG